MERGKNGTTGTEKIKAIFFDEKIAFAHID